MAELKDRYEKYGTVMHLLAFQRRDISDGKSLLYAYIGYEQEKEAVYAIRQGKWCKNVNIDIKLTKWGL